MVRCIPRAGVIGPFIPFSVILEKSIAGGSEEEGLADKEKGAPDMAPAKIAETKTEGTKQKPQSPAVRKNFPETWIWIDSELR